MSAKIKTLTIYNLNNPLFRTEWVSLLGDKYFKALGFEIVLTDKLEGADIIVWDGLISPKMSRLLPGFLSKIKAERYLILVGEGISHNDYISSFEAGKLTNIIHIPGWSALPEKLLELLNYLSQKQKNV
jgi:Ni,Fe-hydrogenase III small subunit